MVSSIEEKEKVRVTWNEIVSGTCESLKPADGNVLCPACMKLTPDVCLTGTFLSCGVRSTKSTPSPNQDDEEEDEDVEMIEKQHAKRTRNSGQRV